MSVVLNARSLESEKPGFESLPAVTSYLWLWVSGSSSLTLSFLHCKAGTTKFSGQRVAVMIK